jgi:enoyl-CoA hydratase
VVIEGEGEKGFCAGGDIRALYESGKAGTEYWYDFYSNEYRLNTLIHEFPKPYIAIMNGITMGGGVGVSVNGSHRIVSDRTVFAMPETGIGLIPDVGGSYFLPRLRGEAGMYLGLTGERMKGPDSLYAGVGTHYVPEGRLGDLVDALCELPAASHHLVDEVLEGFDAALEDVPYTTIEADVDRLFAGGSVADILKALEADGGEWAAKMAKTIRAKSPTSVLVTSEQLRRGAGLSFRAGMRQELRCVMKIRDGHDFYEGVRAVIIDKDNAPQWQPARLEDISADDVQAHFTSLGEKELAFL